MTDAIQVFTTIGNRHDADNLAQALVERHLAGCVQIIGPITSTYRWQGEIESGQEWLCLVKTTKDKYDRLEAAIRELHPYEVPEILALPVVAGHQAYLDWLAGN
jgi:periplasmic divalent cation tolerance protein